MSEPIPKENHRMLHTFLGFLLGVLLCLVALMVCMPLAGILGFRREWMFAVLYGLVLLAAGAIALRKAESVFAQGILIAISVAFILNGIFLAK